MNTILHDISGKYDHRRSWEKQQVWKLDNGFRATVEHSTHYGDMVVRLDFPDGGYWQCSGGDACLPGFAFNWVEEIRNDRGVIAKLVRPLFDRV